MSQRMEGAQRIGRREFGIKSIKYSLGAAATTESLFFHIYICPYVTLRDKEEYSPLSR